jgi:histidyl-tRNA synthetase
MVGVKFQLDPHLVRGLDYYTKTTFEFIGTEGVGAQNAVAGGGRYDRLVEFLGGRPTPAVGFAIGVERILELIPGEEERRGIYLGTLLPEGIPVLAKKGEELRRKGEVVSIEWTPKSLKAHLKSADKGGFRKVMILGEEELKRGEFFEKEL